MNMGVDLVNFGSLLGILDKNLDTRSSTGKPKNLDMGWMVEKFKCI